MDDDGRSLLFFFILSKDSHHISCRHKERINIFKSIEFSLIDSINDGTEMIKDEKIKKRNSIQNPDKKNPHICGTYYTLNNIFIFTKKWSRLTCHPE